MFEKLIQATKALYPTGRAFKLFSNNNIGQLHKALARSEQRVYNRLGQTYTAILPDTFNFTNDMADRWETRLGMDNNSNLTLTQRKLLIKKKYTHPGEIRGRQTVEFFNSELAEAGFSQLKAHQNKFNGAPKPPEELFANVHGGRPHGTAYHGNHFGEVVIDHLDPEIDRQRYKDYILTVPATQSAAKFYRKTFYIADENLEFASVPREQQRALRRVILQFLPCNMICFLQVNYT
jgi:hypothetical protein